MPCETIAAVYIREKGKTLSVFHNCPDLVARARAWQAMAIDKPMHGSMEYWWKQDLNRFSRRQFA